MPEAFHARFPVSVKSFLSDPRESFLPLVFGLRPKMCLRLMNLLVARENKPLTQGRRLIVEKFPPVMSNTAALLRTVKSS